MGVLPERFKEDDDEKRGRKEQDAVDVSHDMRTSKMLAIGLAYYHLNRHSGCVIRPSLVALIEGPLKAGSSPTD
ncbi:hypothetical protein ANTPLA_LOCUS9978 [Anthophora plagiata]